MGRGGSGESQRGEDRSEWPWYAVFLLVVVFSLIATLLFVFPPALARILGVSPGGGEVPGLDLWIGPYVALTTVLLSAIFLFMTLRIDRGARSEAQKEARKEAKHQIKRRHEELAELKQKAETLTENAEAAKKDAETAKAEAVKARDGARVAKKDAEDARGQAAKARDGAQAARKDAEAASGGAELAKGQAELAKTEAKLAEQGASTALEAATRAATRLAELQEQAEAGAGRVPADVEGLVARLESAVPAAQNALADLRTQAQSITAAADRVRPTVEDASRDLDERIRREVAAGLPGVLAQLEPPVASRLAEIVREELGRTRRRPWFRLGRGNDD